MTPLELATLFHNIYERRAPEFGYTTRPETRQFDPTTPNGRLMVAVCGEILQTLKPTTPLAHKVYDLATTLWFRQVNTPGGHPGPAGPAGPTDANWTLTEGDLQGAIASLEAIIALPNPLEVLREMIDAGGLCDHFYDIREREGEGWEGPRMQRWGKACDDARKLLPDSKI
jgi:hypothetical protein